MAKIELDKDVSAAIPQAYLEQYGIVRDDSGALQTTAATGPLVAISKLYQSGISRHGVYGNYLQRVRSAPRYLYPDASGAGVSRTAYWKGEGLTPRILRQYAQKSLLATKVRSACTAGIRSATKLRIGNDRGAGMRVVHKDWSRSKKTPPGFEKVIAHIEDILQRPFGGDAYSPACRTLDTLCAGLYIDLFTLNMPVLEPIYNAQGYVMGCRPVDGGIVIPSWDMIRHWSQDHPAHPVTKEMEGIPNKQDKLDRLSNHLGEDLVTAEWVIYHEGILDGTYAPGRLIVHPMQTDTDVSYFGFPPGYLQMGMEMISYDWVIHDYHGRKFTDASWLSTILAVIGDGVDSEEVDNITAQLADLALGIKKAHKPAVLPMPMGSDLKTVQLSTPQTSMEFKEDIQYYEASFCAVVRRNPEIINGTSWKPSGPSLNGGSEEYAIRLSQEQGHVADVEHIAGMLSDFVQKIHPDARVMAIHAGADYGAVVDLANKQVEHIWPVNEIRNRIDGEAPIGFYLSPEDYLTASEEDKKKYWQNVYNYPADQTFIARLQFAMQYGQPQPQPGQPGEAQAPAMPAIPEAPMEKGHDEGCPCCETWENYF